MADMILLEENVTTGYQWEIAFQSNVNILQNAHVANQKAHDAELAGAAGMRVIEHEPTDPNEGWQMALIYVRPFDPDNPVDFRTYIGVKP